LNTYRKILVGARGTPTSPIAERTAAQLAARLGSELIILKVADPTQSEDGPEVLSSAVRRAAELGVAARPEQRDGAAADTIIATAADLRADLLVMSDFGMGAT
jgi:nucleotide-binding universal stress UspA family protein